MATRPAPSKKAPAKKAAAKKPAAAAPAPKPKAVAAPVVTLKAVFEQLGETHDLPKKQAHGLLADFVTAVTTHLKTGARIRMSGLGYPGGQDARRANGPQSGDRRADLDQGQQKGCVPRGQGTEGGRVGTLCVQTTARDAGSEFTGALGDSMSPERHCP